MAEFILDGSAAEHDLGRGFRLVAPGLVGQGRTHDERPIGLRDGTPGQETAGLDDALAEADMTETMSVELEAGEAPSTGAPVTLRAPNGDDALLLEVPDTGPGWEHVVLAVDEGGAMTWHLPLAGDGAVATPAVRGVGATKQFRIPRAVAPAPRPEDVATRGLVGLVGRKLLKVLVYPVTDLLVGPAVDFFAGRWEARKRPYGVRLMTPENYAAPGAPQLAADDWRRLGSGRALLMLHGTFSTAHGAFGGLSADDVGELARHYEGRVFAFDHHTMSHDPRENVRRLVERLPDDVALDLDVVCHSRGGLVARELVERPAAHGLAPERLRVGRVVFVGVPNCGTALADPDHMVHMIDRLTSITNLLPTGPVSEFLEALITGIKIAGHGGLKSLDGLRAMCPGERYLETLARESAGRAEYYAITADFEPSELAEAAPIRTVILDAVGDRIFGDAANDLVVPTEGVYAANGSPCFPIGDVARLNLARERGVVHTRYFVSPETRRTLKRWLLGEPPVVAGRGETRAR